MMCRMHAMNCKFCRGHYNARSRAASVEGWVTPCSASSAASPHFVFFRRVNMPVITLPDGSQRSYAQPVTVADVALSIGAGLARAALAGKVDGQLVDTSPLIAQDAALAIITGKAAEGGGVTRHPPP